MRAIIIREYELGKKLCGKRAVALGFFDGVHLGHREIIETAVKEAKARSIISAVFTFSSESENIKDDKRIYSTKEKSELIAECGVEEIIICDFSKVKSLSAEDFITKTLCEDLGCALAVSGEDFRFGSGALGNTDLLRKTLLSHGSELICPSDVVWEGEKISSSKIKRLIEEGNVKKAAKMLGSPFFVKSRVKRGLGLGKTFGFPTVNTDLPKVFPNLSSGVYKCVCNIDSKEYRALTNVGTCPTVGERERHIETFLIDFEGDLYDREIRIYFLDFIRPERRFDSVEDLKKQIKVDINNSFGAKE